MRVFSTLRARITLAAAAAILAAVVVFAVVTVLIVDHELHASLDSALRQRAVTVAELAVSAPAVLERPGALEGTASGRQISVEVLASDGGLVARSPSLGALLLPRNGVVRTALGRGRAGFANVAVGGRAMRLYAVPVADAGGPASGGAVLAASDTSDIAGTTSHLGAAVALAGAIIAAVAAVAAGLLTRRALRPLGRLASAAGEIERTADAARRLPEGGREGGRGSGPHDEVSRLTGVLNRMLASLEQARAGERRFLADASHELRTPITALLGNVQYASRHGADAEVLADLRLDAERLARLVDSLLALERAGEAGGRASVSREVALADVVDEAIAGLDGAAARVRVRVDDDATVAGDPAALRRAVANLVENGLVHGPSGGPVTVVVSTAGPTARVAVSDGGPGPDPAAGDRLFQRFWRGEAASERPGSGLGLSIVAAIAAAHEGSVSVDGATFTLVLPALPD
jgi:two-component system, OmpR family, sensor kinase